MWHAGWGYRESVATRVGSLVLCLGGWLLGACLGSEAEVRPVRGGAPAGDSPSLAPPGTGSAPASPDVVRRPRGRSMPSGGPSPGAVGVRIGSTLAASAPPAAPDAPTSMQPQYLGQTLPPVVEAEEAQRLRGYQVGADERASGGQYVVVAPCQPGSTCDPSAGSMEQGVARYRMRARPGVYGLWLRVLAPEASAGAVWLQLGEQRSWQRWDGMLSGAHWHWENFSRADGTPWVIRSDGSDVTVSLASLGSGLQIDKLHLLPLSQSPVGPAAAVAGRNAYARIEAEAYNSSSGIHSTRSAIRSIEDGDWISFDTVDFGEGAQELVVTASSATQGGNLEVRLDARDGELVGDCVIPNTGGWRQQGSVRCSVRSVPGPHELFLMFRGEYAGEELFELDRFHFVPGG